MTSSDCQISIILPCFNAGSHLPSSLETLVEALNSQPLTWEIIVIDDGSTDNTPAVLERFLNPNILLLKADRNRGKYAAIKMGMSQSQGQVVIFTDSDLPYGAEILFVIYQLIALEGYQLVVGDRTHAKSKSLIQVPFVRKLSSRLFNIISRLLFVSNISDTQCGLKGFSRELAHSLVPLIKDNRFGGDLELLTLAQKYNIYLTTVPVTLSFVGNSSVSVIRDSVAILLRALSTIYHWWTGGYPRSLSKVNARKT